MQYLGTPAAKDDGSFFFLLLLATANTMKSYVYFYCYFVYEIRFVNFSGVAV